MQDEAAYEGRIRGQRGEGRGDVHDPAHEQGADGSVQVVVHHMERQGIIGRRGELHTLHLGPVVVQDGQQPAIGGGRVGEELADMARLAAVGIAEGQVALGLIPVSGSW